MKSWIKRSLIGLLGAGIVVGGISACSHRHERHGMGAEVDRHAPKIMGSAHHNRISVQVFVQFDQQRQFRRLVLRRRLPQVIHPSSLIPNHPCIDF